MNSQKRYSWVKIKEKKEDKVLGIGSENRHIARELTYRGYWSRRIRQSRFGYLRPCCWYRRGD